VENILEKNTFWRLLQNHFKILPLVFLYDLFYTAIDFSEKETYSRAAQNVAAALLRLLSSKKSYWSWNNGPIETKCSSNEPIENKEGHQVSPIHIILPRNWQRRQLIRLIRGSSSKFKNHFSVADERKSSKLIAFKSPGSNIRKSGS
jgi:hypothetical protein